MKRALYKWKTCMMLVVGGGSVFGEGSLRSGIGEVRPLPTHGQLQERRESARIDPKIAIVENPKPLQKIRSDQSQSLLDRSTVLVYRGHWTLVPKGSVLHVPLNLKSRIGKGGQGDLLPWPDFLSRNRTWLRAHPRQDEPGARRPAHDAGGGQEVQGHRPSGGGDVSWRTDLGDAARRGR